MIIYSIFYKCHDSRKCCVFFVTIPGIFFLMFVRSDLNTEISHTNFKEFATRNVVATLERLRCVS